METLKADILGKITFGSGNRKHWVFGFFAIISVVLLLTCCIIIITRFKGALSEEDGQRFDQSQTAMGAMSMDHDVNDDPKIYEDCHFTDEILSMAKGVDITKLDLLPLSLKGIEGNPGIKAQLIKLTCSRKFSKLDTSGNFITRIPDQFVPNSYETMSAFGASIDTEEHTERSTRDSKVSLGLTVGIDMLKLGMFSSSASYERKRKQMLSGESYISEMNAFYLVRSAEFRSPISKSLPLEGNEDFQNEVDYLAPSFEEGPQGYLDLLAKYGTHYFAMARFGGFVKVTTEVTKGLRQAMSEDEIQAKLEFAYKVLFKGSMNFDLFQNVTSHEFKGMSSSAKYSHGGDPSLAFSGDLEKWIRSVPRSPRLVGGKLVSIKNLVRNQSRAGALERAIQVYLGQAYVNDLATCLKIYQVKGLGDVFHQRKIQASLAAITPEELQDESRLHELGVEVSQSMQQESFGPVTITVYRGEPPSSEVIAVLEDQCMWIEISVYAVIGNRSRPKFVKRQTLKTAEASGSDPVWNERFQINLQYEAAIQFCVYSRTCSSRIASETVSSSGISCASHLPIFIPQNRHAGIESLQRFSDLSLIYSIFWEPQSGPEQNAQPI